MHVRCLTHARMPTCRVLAGGQFLLAHAQPPQLSETLLSPDATEKNSLSRCVSSPSASSATSFGLFLAHLSSSGPCILARVGTRRCTACSILNHCAVVCCSTLAHKLQLHGNFPPALRGDGPAECLLGSSGHHVCKLHWQSAVHTDGDAR
jgi:hypothetical protein